LVQLFPVFVDFWVESSALAFESVIIRMSPHLQICSLVLKTLVNLGTFFDFKSPQCINLGYKALFVKHVSKDFPFAGEMTVQDMQVELVLGEMNLNYCSLLVALGSTDKELSKVQDYLYRFFDLVMNNSSDIRGFDIALELCKRIAHAPHVDILPVLIRLQCSRNLSQEKSHAVFNSIAQLATKEQLNDDIREWIYSLPKQLWKLKQTNLSMSKEILQFLVNLIKQGGLADTPDFLAKLQLALVPSLVSQVQQKLIFGPFVDYPCNIQMIFLDLIFYCATWSDTLLKAMFQVSVRTFV
jgi:hypothetical protein